MSSSISRWMLLFVALICVTALADDGDKSSTSNAKITVPKDWKLYYHESGPRPSGEYYSVVLTQDGSMTVKGGTKRNYKTIFDGTISQEHAEAIYRKAVVVLRRTDFDDGGASDGKSFSLSLSGSWGRFDFDDDGLVHHGRGYNDFGNTIHDALPATTSP